MQMPDFGTQLKNYGMQLQNLSSEIQNLGMQLQNMMQNFGVPLQNMAIQISNYAMEIFKMGLQMPNNNNSQIMINNMELQNRLMINDDNLINDKNNKINENLINIIFLTYKGKIFIICNENITVEELLKLFIRKFNYKDNEEKLNFIYNGQEINHQEKKKLYEFGFNNSSSIEVIYYKDILAGNINKK